MAIDKIQKLFRRYGSQYTIVVILIILISSIIYLLVERTKTKPPPALQCPEYPKQPRCLNYELMSSARGDSDVVSPGIMYHLSAGLDRVALEGYDLIWKVDAPGAVIMKLNEKGQLQAKNGNGEVVFETPEQKANVPYVAYVSNEGKLEIMDRNERKVVFSK